MFQSRYRAASALSASVLMTTAAVTAATVPASSRSQPAPGLDILIRGGTVVDGSGLPRYRADVGISGGRIVAVGNVPSAGTKEVVDATGLVVAPGFIDLHSHGDPKLIAAGPESSLRQGVTTEMLNPDGFGTRGDPFDTLATPDVAKTLKFAKRGAGINVGAYVGFNAIWNAVMRKEDRHPTAAEFRRMRGMITNGLRDGAWGVSAGLFYTPAVYASTNEVIRVVEPARRWRTLFTNHSRSEQDDVAEATAETIRIGEKTGLVPVITHMKVQGPANWGASVRTVRLIEQANARGHYTAADVYPYVASQTFLTAVVPSKILAGGRKAMLKRFKNPDGRPRIARQIEKRIASRVPGPEAVRLPAERKTLADLAAEWKVSPGEAVMRYLETEGDVLAIYLFGREDDLRRIMRNPVVAIASDGGATDADRHPRHYGSQPRVLGRYVRDQHVLTLEDAVRKMTGLPATITGMADRGFIAAGMAADVAIFDSATIIDRATFDKPRQYATGVHHVIVGGQLALRGGELTGVRAGQALQRTVPLPSRPMTPVDRPVAADVSGMLASGKQVRLNARMSVGARNAIGTLSVAGSLSPGGSEGSGYRFTATRFGKLQTAAGWAAITGVGRLGGDSRDRAFTVLVDRLGKDRPRFVLDVAGADVLSGNLSTR